MRVLVVEDESSIAKFVLQGLTEAGYAVDLVGDGRSALDFALTTDYDAGDEWAGTVARPAPSR